MHRAEVFKPSKEFAVDEKTIQFRVGVLVVATVIITMILVALFGEFPKGLQGTTTVYVRFTSAPGVSPNTPVRKSGILVGRVEDVDLEDDGRVYVTMRLDKNRRIRENEICRISTGNFLGDAMIEFVPSDAPGLSQDVLEDGAQLTGVVSPDAMSAIGSALQVFDHLAVEVKGTLASIEGTSQDIGQVAKNLNVLVVNNEDQFNRLLTKAEQAFGRFDTAMVAVNQVVSDEELAEKLRTVLDAFPTVLSDASLLMRDLRTMANEAETNFKFLQGLTKPLEEKGEEIVSTLSHSLNRLDSVLLELQTFAKSINSAEGSLGQFVHNPDLYQRLNNAAGNIEELTYQLEPIVDDARVISDKLARNPGRILRGAIGRQQSGLK
jgi:phospholipid/cholesterol/gamma-HCH transport system substrate-binding protein